MPLFDQTDVPSIAPRYAEQAHRAIKAHYASVLESLPAQQLTYQLDVENNEDGPASEQQHQLVISEVGRRRPATLRLWLRADGLLVDLKTGLVSADNLRTRVEQWQKGLQQFALWEQRYVRDHAARVKKIVVACSMVLAAAALLPMLGMLYFGFTPWVLAALKTAMLLLGVMVITLSFWLRNYQHREREARGSLS